MVKKTILVADDDLLMVRLLDFTLSSKKFDVLKAFNGREALEVLGKRNSNVDLIITDYSMPIVNGLELANSIRIDKKYKNIPLILITANADITSKPDKQYKVFNEIIPKPFTSELIIEKVTALLGRK